MCIKLIAAGNRIMGDDGVAAEAAEILQEELKEIDIETIIGETDVEYCLSRIAYDDLILILDASITERPFGIVWSMPLHEALKNCSSSQSQHDADLLHHLGMNKLNLSGLLICIEIADVELRWGLSTEIQRELPRICSDIKRIILKFRSGIKHA